MSVCVCVYGCGALRCVVCACGCGRMLGAFKVDLFHISRSEDPFHLEDQHLTDNHHGSSF